MTDSFMMEAPMVWADGYNPKSGYSKLVAAMGRMLGGLTVDGATFKFDGTDFSLAAAQLILIEAGLDLFVMGASYAVDEKSSFIAMADGSVWRFSATVVNGKLRTEGRVASNEEIGTDCVQSVAMHGAIKALALKQLAKEGLIGDGDSWMGHVVVDGHAAILMRPFGYGVLIVSAKDGTDKTAWKFAIDSPRNAHMEEAEATMQFQPLSKEEVVELKRQHMTAQIQTVEGNPFPQKVGVA